MNRHPSLKDKSVFIAGGGTGIGAAIRVNTVIPGWVMTERRLKFWVDAAGKAEMDRQQSLAGRVMPIDIARMVLFLVADDSKMCSAQEFTVDGGWV